MTDVPSNIDFGKLKKAMEAEATRPKPSYTLGLVSDLQQKGYVRTLLEFTANLNSTSVFNFESHGVSYKKQSVSETLQQTILELEQINKQKNDSRISQFIKALRAILVLRKNDEYVFLNESLALKHFHKTDRETIMLALHNTLKVDLNISNESRPMKNGYQAASGYDSSENLYKNVFEQFCSSKNKMSSDSLAKVLLSYFLFSTLERYPKKQEREYFVAMKNFLSNHALTKNINSPKQAQKMDWAQFQDIYTQLLKDFKEQVDIPQKNEPSNKILMPSIRYAAQGPFATTCTVYTALSMFEKLGHLKKLIGPNASYGDVDRYTAKQLAAGDYGQSFPDLLKYMNRESHQGKWQHWFVSVQIDDENLETFLNKLPNSGMIMAINHELGPHVVHITQFDSKLKTVTFYDPIGKDGQANLKTMSIEALKKIIFRDQTNYDGNALIALPKNQLLKSDDFIYDTFYQSLPESAIIGNESYFIEIKKHLKK
jgi:hypothetical protein